MSADDGKSNTISPRRRLLEEVLEERSKVLAGLPLEAVDPPSGSWRWPLGLRRLASAAPGRGIEDRRDVALKVAVVALAWLEAIDAELRAREASPEG